jgi:transcription termination factor NusB
MSIKTLFARFASRIKRTITDRITPNVAGLLTKIAKIEATIENAIDRDVRKLAVVQQAITDLTALRKAVDADVNAAYKLLHNIGGLVK